MYFLMLNSVFFISGKMETVNSSTSSSSSQSCEGVFHLGDGIVVNMMDSDSGDDFISISDDENDPISDQNVSSSVLIVGLEVGEDDTHTPAKSEDVPMRMDEEVSEPSKSLDMSQKDRKKPFPIFKFGEAFVDDKLPMLPEPKEASENPSGGTMEEIFPIPPEYRSPDEEVAGISSVIKRPSGSVPVRPINPNPDQLHAKNVREAFAEFKERYPTTIPDAGQGSAKLIRGRAFSISEVARLNNKALKNYWKVAPGTVPIPSGFWEEMARLDSLLEAHYDSMDLFLPNEDWIFRRMDEGNTPWLILRRYFGILLL